MEAHGAAQRPGKVSIPPVPQFSSLSGPRSGRAVLRLVAVPRDRPVEASLENLHSIPDPQSHDPLLWNGKNSPQHSSGAGLNEPLPGMAGNKRHAAFRLLPLIGARVAPLGPASSGSLRSASPSSSPWVDISTLSPQSPDFWRLGSGPQAATQAADQAASADTVLVLRRLDSGLVDLSGLLLALGHPTLLHGLIACELAEAELGLSPSGPHGAILTPPSPAPPELCLPAMSVPDAAWVPPPVARRCIDLIRRKRLLANPNRHHRRGKDSPYRPSYLGPFAPPGASVASTPSSATPDLEEAIGPWQLLGCLTDANSEYMRVWYKEVDGEPGAEANFRMLPEFATPDPFIDVTPSDKADDQGKEEWEARCSWDILGPLTTPYFLSFVRQTEPFSSPLGKRNSSSATLTNLPIAESKFPPHPFLLDRQKDYPEPVILLSQKMQHYRRLQLDLFFAIATSQRANVRDACGGEVLETFLSALEEHPREVAAASYLSSLILLDTPGELLDLSKRNESLEAELISGLTTACDFLERACLIRRGLGRKWEASVELLAKELVQIKNRGLKMSPRGEGIAVLDLVAGDEEEGSAERAAGFRRWQLKKIGERTRLRALRLVDAYQRALRIGEPLRSEEASLDPIGTGHLSPGPRLGEWLRGGPDEQPHEKSETSPPLLPDRPDLAIFTTTPAVAEAPLSPTSPLSIRRRLSEILFKGNKPPKAVHFGAEAEEPGPAPTIAVPSLSQSVPLRRKPPPKSEAFTNLLRSLSVPSGLSAPSQLSGPSSPGALIAAAKTPALTEIPRLADEIGGLHADARGEMGMRTPFVEMAKDSQEEALMSSGSSASSGSDSGSNDGGEAEAPATPMTPVAAPAMPVPRPAGTRVKIERKRSGFVEGARHFFGLNKGV